MKKTATTLVVGLALFAFLSGFCPLVHGIREHGLIMDAGHVREGGAPFPYRVTKWRYDNVRATRVRTNPLNLAKSYAYCVALVVLFSNVLIPLLRTKRFVHFCLGGTVFTGLLLALTQAIYTVYPLPTRLSPQARSAVIWTLFAAFSFAAVASYGWGMRKRKWWGKALASLSTLGLAVVADARAFFVPLGLVILISLFAGARKAAHPSA